MFKKLLLILIGLILGMTCFCVFQQESKIVKDFSFDSTEREKPIKHLVIHSFSLSPRKMMETLHQYGLSVHYLIDANGTIHHLVPENKVTWHAGPSFWAGETGLNTTSIGIELEHPEFGQTPFPDKQIHALIKLAKEIIEKYHIQPENIVAHSDIAPEGKMDPGRGFPWQELSEQNIGLWYDITDSEKMSDFSVSELLSIIGYPTTTERQLEASSWAFRQRFMPEVVPYDSEIAKRGEAMFQARQKVANLPQNEREQALSQIPPIYPENDGTYLTDPEFIKVLRAVAYQYQHTRKNKILENK